MPNLQDFISEFKHGFQQASRFHVQIFVQPTMILNIIREASLLGVVDATLSVTQAVKWLAFGFLACDARLPDRGFGMTPSNMYGMTEHFPYHTEYSNLECTFLMPHTTNVLQDNGIPRFFNFWQNQIQNMTDGPESGLTSGFRSHYYAHRRPHATRQERQRHHLVSVRQRLPVVGHVRAGRMGDGRPLHAVAGDVYVQLLESALASGKRWLDHAR
jgi:hypothetical protein